MAEQKKNDEAVKLGDALSQSEVFINKYKTHILAAIAAIILIIFGIWAWNHFYKAPRESKAQIALIKGEQYFENDNYKEALEGDSLGYTGFLKIVDKFSGTKAANLANAYAGICYAKLGKPQEAIKYLDKFSAKDQMAAPAMKGSIGNCYIQLNNLDKGVDLLLAAAKEADNNSLSPIFLQQAGEVLLQQGKFDKALDAFNQIKYKYFRSYQATEVDKYIEKANLLKK